MKSWLLRGLVFAFLIVVVRLVQGAMINTWETQALLISIFLIVLYALAALLWGFLDGRHDANAEPDPDRRADLAMTWLLAGLVAGILGGAIAWVISLFYKTLYVEGLINEITTFAAFVALLTFVFAIVGVSLGRWITDRRAERRGAPVGRHRGGDDDNPDTDVFAAVGGRRSQAEEAEGESAETSASGAASEAAGGTASGVAGEHEPRTEPQRIQSEHGSEQGSERGSERGEEGR
ncbi:MAG: B-4DMT family transporter [Mycobacteriaceae bacterium]|nr:B-4DMT family transporter [Mycobacteriaceae bacterium]